MTMRKHKKSRKFRRLSPHITNTQYYVHAVGRNPSTGEPQMIRQAFTSEAAAQARAEDLRRTGMSVAGVLAGGVPVQESRR